MMKRLLLQVLLLGFLLLGDWREFENERKGLSLLAKADKLNIFEFQDADKRKEEEHAVVSIDDDPTSATAPVVLVCTIDGEIHGLDSSSGEELWSTSLGGSVIHSYNSMEAIKVGAVVPGDDGMLYVYSDGGVLEQYDVSIPDLVEMSPIVQKLPNGHSLTIVGERSSSVLSVDANRGNVVMLSSAKDEEIIMEAGYHPDAQIVSIGRVDYHVRAFDQVTKKEVWNFTYGHFETPGSQFKKNIRKEMPGNRVTLDGLAVSAMFAGSLDNLVRMDVVINDLDNDKNDLDRALTDSVPVDGKISTVHVLAFKNHQSKRQLFASANPLGKDISDYMNKGNLKLMLPQVESVAKSDESILSIDIKKTGTVLPHCDPALMDSEDICPNDMTGPYVVENKKKPPDPETQISGTEAAQAQERNIVFTSHKFIATTMFVLFGWLAFRRWTSSNPNNSDEKWIDESTLRIGSLTVNMKEIKGKGCHGTVVYTGKLGKRPVAVKRMLVSMYDVANKEIDLLIKSDGHKNVVRYFAQERCRDFVYLALELCTTTMDAVLCEKRDDAVDIPAIEPIEEINTSTVVFLRDLTDAVSHLHDLRIVHCDIKPQNILVVSKNGGLEGGLGDLWIPKISDMGLGRKIGDGTSSIGASIGYGASIGLSSMQGAGTQGWRAPELLKKLSRSRGRINDRDVASRCGRAVDVFSLGCVFFYTLTDGHHPFGDIFERENQILDGLAKHMEMLSLVPEAADIISKMIAINQEDRPSLRAALNHPFLWEAKKKLSFICLLSDRLKSDRPGMNQLRSFVDSFGRQVFGRTGWWDNLDELFQTDIYSGSHVYNYYSVCDLLRFIRNKRSHLQELQVKDMRGITSTPELFLQQFVGRLKFPRLLLVCYEIVKATCAHESEFKEFLGKEVATQCHLNSLNWFRNSTDENRDGSAARYWYPKQEDWVHHNHNSSNGSGAFSSLKQKTRNSSRPRTIGGKQKMQLCKHWERTGGTWCAKGKECNFAHGMIELRHSRYLRPSRNQDGERTWRNSLSPNAIPKYPRSETKNPPIIMNGNGDYVQKQNHNRENKATLKVEPPPGFEHMLKN